MPKPSFLMSQPMMCSVFDQKYSPIAPTRGARRGAIAVRVADRAAQHDGGGSVAEQRRGDEHGEARVVDAQAERAQVDGEKQNVGAGPRLRHARRAGEPADAAAAAEPEDRQPLDVRTEGEPVHEAGFEAGDREAGDRVGDDGVDVAKRKTGLGHRLRRHPLQQVERVTLVGPRSILPGVRLQVPFLRLDRVAPLDAGVVVEGVEARILRKDLLRPLGDFLLTGDVRRHRRGDGGDLHTDCRRGETTRGAKFGVYVHVSATRLHAHAVCVASAMLDRGR